MPVPNKLKSTKTKKGSAKKPVQSPSIAATNEESGAMEVCPVVGVGASAGGLEAFTELLQRLPADPGFAIVFIQHLDPKHSSILTQLLARSTQMRVQQIRDSMPVLPNQVYVIPPNSNIHL